MSLFRKSKKDRITASRKKRGDAKKSIFQAIDGGQLLTSLLYVLTAILLILICFAGLTPSAPTVLPDQTAHIRIVSDIDFEFESKLLTEMARQRRIQEVPPVFSISLEPYEEFAEFTDNLLSAIEEFNQLHQESELSKAEKESALRQFLAEQSLDSRYYVSTEDFFLFAENLDRETRRRTFEEVLRLLRDIFQSGIVDPTEDSPVEPESGVSMITVRNLAQDIAESRIQTKTDATRALRTYLAVIPDLKRETRNAFFRLFSKPIQTNLIYSEQATKEKEEAVAKQITPVIQKISRGQTIIEPGTRITNLEIERLNAYNREIKERADQSFGYDRLFIERAFFTAVIVFAVALFVKLGSRKHPTQNKKLLLAAVVFLLNMSFIRVLMEIGTSDFFINYSSTLNFILPFVAPVALGPMIVAIIAGSGPGILVALIVAIFHAMMLGNSMSIMLISFLTALVGIYTSRNITVRTKVVRAGILAGTVQAACALFAGLASGLDFLSVTYQFIGAIVMGGITGIFVVGFLPIFENLFKLTTDISLLELTDFNHPLLRKMQLTTPGSYHHSLMVANLSERAAIEIGANPLVCRVCALYHDIGKTVKPEYYTENQREGINPHLEKNPSMSALVIKSHVKEGVIMAKQYKLPKIIIDVIKQHHGTSLIQYFYYMALKKQEQDTAPPFYKNAPRISLDKVNESTYRYEGPKPQFKESAIIFLADSVEAASRSLKKPSAQAIDELINNIFHSRLEDGQLSECPLTYQELALIKKSFSFSLVNMLHTRIEYPNAQKQEEAQESATENPPEGPAEKPIEAEPVAEKTDKAPSDKPREAEEPSAAPNSSIARYEDGEPDPPAKDTGTRPPFPGGAAKDAPRKENENKTDDKASPKENGEKKRSNQ